MKGIFLRKYGAEATIDFQLFEIDGVDFRTDAAHVAGDTTLMQDEGAEGNTTNGFTDEGQGYSIVLTAAEMQAARNVVYIVDQGTKVWLDAAIVIETYGHASAMHAIDLDDSVRAGLTALPNAVPDAAGGLAISDAGGLDLDTLLGTLTSLAAETRDANVLDQIKRVLATIESQRGYHTGQGNTFYVDPVNGDTHANGNRGGKTDPYAGFQDCHNNAVTDSNHDIIFLVAGAAAGVTTLTEDVTISKRYLLIRGPGRDFIWTRSGNGDTIAITADGVELAGFQLETAATGAGHGIQVTDADFHRIHHVWINQTRGDGINLLRASNCQIHDNTFIESGQTGVGEGIHIIGTAGSSNNNVIEDNKFLDVQGDAIKIEAGSTLKTIISRNKILGSTGWGIDIGASSTDAFITDNRFGNNASGSITDAGTTTVLKDNGSNVGYEGGAVWVDTGAANTNTVSYVDGIATNPVSTIASAKTIADALGLKIFRLSPDSSITLAAAYDGYVFDGPGAVVALGGQSINGSVFLDVKINGNDDGSNSTRVRYEGCDIDGSTLGQFIACRCRLTGDIIFAQAGSYFLDQCFSGVAGTSTPSIDFGAALGVTNLNMRHYSGGIEIKNMGNVGADQMSLEGRGQLVINANCDPSNSPVIAIRGLFTLTDNVAGGFVDGGGTISDDARYDVAQINTEVDTALSDYDGPTKAEMDTAHALLATVTALATAQLDLDTLTDATALPGQEVPTATPTLTEAIMMIYKFLTNKRTDDGTNIKIFARDETTVDQKNTISDDGSTYTHGEFGTGP